MKSIIWLSILLALGVFAGYFIQQDQGYVILSYRHWLVEMSLVLMAALLLVTFFICYAVLRMTSKVVTTPERFKLWKKHRKSHKARLKMIQGLIELTEGNWKKAEDLLSNSVNHDTSLLNYLGAARAAQELGAYQRRDDYLRIAHNKYPQADIAVSLSQAQLQLSHKQLEQALATLMHLKSIAPKQGYVLKLLKRLYVALNDWQQLLLLVPELQKQKIIDNQEAASLRKTAFSHLLDQPYSKHNVQSLFEMWRKAPDSVLYDTELNLKYCQCLVEAKQHNEAEVILREAIKRTWDDKLIEQYGLVEGKETAKQLATAERWLESQPHNATLLLCLGRLALRNHLWGKAKQYLETSISISPSVEAYRELALLLERLEEHEKSQEYFRQGIMLSTQNLPEYPLPKLKNGQGKSHDEHGLMILGA